MPFGEYKDFDDCVKQNQDKDSPEAYCATIEKKITGKWPGQKKSKLEKIHREMYENGAIDLPTHRALLKDIEDAHKAGSLSDAEYTRRLISLKEKIEEMLKKGEVSPGEYEDIKDNLKDDYMGKQIGDKEASDALNELEEKLKEQVRLGKPMQTIAKEMLNDVDLKKRLGSFTKQDIEKAYVEAVNEADVPKQDDSEKEMKDGQEENPEDSIPKKKLEKLYKELGDDHAVCPECGRDKNHCICEGCKTYRNSIVKTPAGKIGYAYYDVAGMTRVFYKDGTHEDIPLKDIEIIKPLAGKDELDNYEEFSVSVTDIIKKIKKYLTGKVNKMKESNYDIDGIINDDSEIDKMKRFAKQINYATEDEFNQVSRDGDAFATVTMNLIDKGYKPDSKYLAESFHEAVNIGQRVFVESKKVWGTVERFNGDKAVVKTDWAGTIEVPRFSESFKEGNQKKKIGPYTLEVRQTMGRYKFSINYNNEVLADHTSNVEYEVVEDFNNTNSERDVKQYIKQNSSDYKDIKDAYPELELESLETDMDDGSKEIPNMTEKELKTKGLKKESLNNKLEKLQGRFKEIDTRYQNSDGTFKKMHPVDDSSGKENKFNGCVRYQMSQGKSQESAEKICAYIARNKGK